MQTCNEPVHVGALGANEVDAHHCFVLYDVSRTSALRRNRRAQKQTASSQLSHALAKLLLRSCHGFAKLDEAGEIEIVLPIIIGTTIAFRAGQSIPRNVQ